jgi:hypothetical protein
MSISEWSAVFSTSNGFRIVHGPKRHSVYCTNGYYVSPHYETKIIRLDPDNLTEITLTPPEELVLLRYDVSFDEYKSQVEKIGTILYEKKYEPEQPLKDQNVDQNVYEHYINMNPRLDYEIWEREIYILRGQE